MFGGEAEWGKLQVEYASAADQFLNALGKCPLNWVCNIMLHKLYNTISTGVGEFCDFCHITFKKP